MSYSADKLTAIFECTVSDLINIEAYMLKPHYALSNSGFMRAFLECLPIDEFHPRLKVNRFWYHYCKAELKHRWKMAENTYDIAEKEWEKAGSALDQVIDAMKKDKKLEWKEYQKACDIRRNARIGLNEMERSLERFGFQGKYNLIQDRMTFAI
jgi:hypothetical protein